MAPKGKLADVRDDFGGGLNVVVTEDQANANELLDATNVRLTAVYGGLAKRSGTRRLHETAIGAGADVIGVYQWDAPGGKEIVAVSNGKFYHKTTELGAFAEVVPDPAFPTGAGAWVSFAPFRSTAADAALLLFITSSSGVCYSWDGSAPLVRVDGVGSAPTASLLAAYNTRMFYNKINQKKHAFWSVIGDAADCTIGDASQGGAAIVDTLTGEEIVALGVVGSSLVFATEDSLARFTGYSNDDVVLAEGTKGIAASLGAAGPRCLRPVEDFLAALAERGPYLVTESGIQFIGTKVEPKFDGFNRSILAQSVVQYHRGRRELWFTGRIAGVDSDVKSLYAWSVRQQAWAGPWTYPFAIRDLARYEDAAGDEWVIAGCDDGFVRHMDTGAKDDVLWDASAGSNITMTAEVAPTFFETGPSRLKSLRRMTLQADLLSTTDLRVNTNKDKAGWVEQAAVTGLGAGARSYRVDVDGQVYRLGIQFVDASAFIPIIHGYVLVASDMQRP